MQLRRWRLVGGEVLYFWTYTQLIDKINSHTLRFRTYHIEEWDARRKRWKRHSTYQHHA